MNWFPDRPDRIVRLPNGREFIRWGRYRTYNDGTFWERRRYDLLFTLPLKVELFLKRLRGKK